MSEVKLNLVDAWKILCGTIHGSIGDACVAALSAEPESLSELEAALKRYIGPGLLRVSPKSGDPEATEFVVQDLPGPFASFHSVLEIDEDPWDAGIVIIDLAARIVAADSTYSQPQQMGEVVYHDGARSTDLGVLYSVSDDWTFLDSIAQYKSLRLVRKRERENNPPLDARSILYGRPLLEFVVDSVRQSQICCEARFKAQTWWSDEPAVANREATDPANDTVGEKLAEEISAIHERWLMTVRNDLRGQSPREVLLAKRHFIDFDMQTRQLQWTEQGVGPPCLPPDSYAYRCAGFGTHECVLYYDLVRHLLWMTFHFQETNDSIALEAEIVRLEQTKTEWLENPQEDISGRVPAIIIDNERRRLPITLQAQDLIIDEDCELCVMSSHEVDVGYVPAFWCLDGSNMEDTFAFSFCRTQAEWEEENRQREEFNREFDRRWEERQHCLCGGPLDDEFDLDWIDSLNSRSSSKGLKETDESGDMVQ